MLKLLKRIKGIYLNFNLRVSNNIFYSNTYFFKILKTLFFNYTLKLSNDYIPNSGNIELSKKDADKIKSSFKACGNLNKPNSFYSVQTLEYIPGFYSEILKKHRSDIENYLGKNFKYENIILTSRKNIPDSMAGDEFYNNTWHQDSDTYKLLKIFLLIDTVTSEDGPFTYLSLTDSKKYWRKIKDRNGGNSILDIDEQLTFTGNRGSYFISDPTRRLHRASNPKTKRYMFSMTLYPHYEENITDIERFTWGSE